MFYIYFVTSFC